MTRALLVLLLVAAAPASALRLFEKNHPKIELGMSRYEKGDFAGALKAFDEAQTDRPTDPLVHYDRGLALHKLGRTDEALEAFRKADELDPQHGLGSKVPYNRGTVFASQGARKEAIREFRAALKRDPTDELARHNLEVLLRNLPPENPSPGDGGSDAGSDGGRPDAGADGGRPDGGTDGGPQDGGQADGGGHDDGGSDGGQDGGQQGGQQDGGKADGGQQRRDGGEGTQGSQDDAGHASPTHSVDAGADGGSHDAGSEEEQRPNEDWRDGGRSHKQAIDLLDRMGPEKPFPMWKDPTKTRKNDTHGKDW